ncbi:hypothetical protein [Streptomyces sp. NRRL B-24572]|uniref:hypothetical protein n=1 Tax=Streptomyces sp. NRRL B-24572 TaxID=1962156 RepID=UPI000A3A05EA|nr:hypothetical protein [Streptomyces sp. NRRL B-24572]
MPSRRSSPVTGLRVTGNDANGGRPRVGLEWDRIDSRADGLVLQRFDLTDGSFVNVFDVTGDAARSMTAYEDASGFQLVTPYRYGLRTCRGAPGDARSSAYATVVATTAAPPPAPSASRWQQPERIALLGQFGVHTVSAVVARGAQRVDAFVMGRDTRHTVQHFLDGGGRRTADLGAFEARSRLVAACWGPDRVDLFYRGADDRLKQRPEVPWAGGWTGEVDPGGRMPSAAAAVSWGPNRLDVFYLGNDAQYRLFQHSWYAPGNTWTPATTHDGSHTTPMVGSRGPGTLYLFYGSGMAPDFLMRRRYAPQ